VRQTGTFATLTLNGTTQASATSFTANGYNYAVDYNVPDGSAFDIDLVAVPEPSSATAILALVLFAVAFAGVRRSSANSGRGTRPA
jgi:hypothetical protein